MARTDIYLEAESRRRWRARKPRHTSLNAGALMTSPAITIHPDAPIPSAARVMNTHHVRRLPVLDSDGQLVGIVSHRDLLSAFLRPDADITADARQDLVALAIRMSWDVDGVVDVRNRINEVEPTPVPSHS